MAKTFPLLFPSPLLALLVALLFTGCAIKQSLSPGIGVSPVIGRADLAMQIQAILKDPKLAASTKGVKVVRLRDNKILFEKNSTKLFHPASTMKLFTAAAALKYLGSEYRFTTRLALAPGTLQDGTIKGNLYLIGRGDPSLRSGDLFTLAEQLQSLGVHTVSGNLICDDTYFDDVRYGAGWMWDDQPYKDFAPIGRFLSTAIPSPSLFPPAIPQSNRSRCGRCRRALLPPSPMERSPSLTVKSPRKTPKQTDR